MARNGRFMLSLRILAVLAKAPKAMHTSAAIAEELSESAVVIRRYFLLLESRGLIEQRRGPRGGARLKTAAREIGVGDVYLAAESDWLEIGNPTIAGLLERAREDGVSAMNEVTLAQILRRMKKKNVPSSKTYQKLAKRSKRERDARRKPAHRGKAFSFDVGRTLRSLIPAADAPSNSYA